MTRLSIRFSDQVTGQMGWPRSTKKTRYPSCPLPSLPSFSNFNTTTSSSPSVPIQRNNQHKKREKKNETQPPLHKRKLAIKKETSLFSFFFITSCYPIKLTSKIHSNILNNIHSKVQVFDYLKSQKNKRTEKMRYILVELQACQFKTNRKNRCHCYSKALLQVQQREESLKDVSIWNKG